MRMHHSVIFMLLLTGAACTRPKATPRQETVVQVGSTSLAPFAVTLPPALPSSASVVQHPASPEPSNATLPGPLAPTDIVHCKALGKRGLHPIATLQSDFDAGVEIVDLVVESAHVVALLYRPDLARFAMAQYRRDGGPVSIVGSHTGLGVPLSPIVLPDAVYFTRNRALFRMLRANGEVTELAKGFSYGIAIEAGYVYGFNCDAKMQIDRLRRISSSGGEIEALATIDRNVTEAMNSGQRNCDYRHLISDSKSIYAAHWNGRRIVRYSLADRTMQAYVTKLPYPMGLNFVGDDIVFQAADGIHRCSKASPNTTRITELGQSPFAFIAVSGTGLVIQGSKPYINEDWMYELPWSTGKPRKLEHFERVTDQPGGDIGIRGLAIDSECIYVARQLQNSLVIYARSLQ